MRLANYAGRATVLSGEGGIDIAEASGGRFGPGLQGIYEQWDVFCAWAADGVTDAVVSDIDPARLESPAPQPPQVFAIGLNYLAHAEESGMQLPTVPAVFTKYPSSLTGPYDDITLSGATVDWEVELVVVMAHRVDSVAPEDAWRHVAGLAVGQDVSDRTMQFAAAAQFALGKSYRGYGPIGPFLVTPDELPDPTALRLSCSVNGETVQDGSTANMVFSVGELISRIAAVCPLLPGDVIFTGTPDGCGVTANPPRFLKAGDVLESTIEGIGTIRNLFVGSE
jgi:2-keto-4-pentenoate hydratase/2-oxohepta-3-ene-1,7-dioic acid hydratase in catechol pathway